MESAPEGITAKDLFDAYEAGKHRRYNLLFAANGGAFAVARLWAENSNGTSTVLGGLTLQALAVGMVAFTGIMGADIFTFGARMREALTANPARPPVFEVFGPVGRLVLSVLGLLTVAGWLLVGFGGVPPA